MAQRQRFFLFNNRGGNNDSCGFFSLEASILFLVDYLLHEDSSDFLSCRLFACSMMTLLHLSALLLCMEYASSIHITSYLFATFFINDKINLITMLNIFFSLEFTFILDFLILQSFVRVANSNKITIPILS
jgi:hypothetical protein